MKNTTSTRHGILSQLEKKIEKIAKGLSEEYSQDDEIMINKKDILYEVAHRACTDILEKVQEEKTKEMMELKDTVALMLSDDYKDRFFAEYIQTKIRYEKLKAMNTKRLAGVLDFEPKCSIDILRKQQSIMGQLLEMLEVRAYIEEIPLPSYNVPIVE